MVGLAPRVLVGLELKSHDVWVECPERVEDLFGGKFALHLEALASLEGISNGSPIPLEQCHSHKARSWCGKAW